MLDGEEVHEDRAEMRGRNEEALSNMNYTRQTRCHVTHAAQRGSPDASGRTTVLALAVENKEQHGFSDFESTRLLRDNGRTA